MQEIWKEYKGYLISNKGKIIGRKGKIIKPFTVGKGYLCFVIGHKIKVYVHRMVALLFIPNPKNKKTVNHKNGIKTDNRVENLEWNTYSENNQHAYDLNLKKANPKVGSENHMSKLSEEDVFVIRGLLEHTTLSRKIICVIFGINDRSVSNIKLKKTWKHI